MNVKLPTISNWKQNLEIKKTNKTCCLGDIQEKDNVFAMFSVLKWKQFTIQVTIHVNTILPRQNLFGKSDLIL